MHVIQDEIIRHQLSHDYTLVHQCRWKQSTKIQYFYRLMYIVFLNLFLSYFDFPLTIFFVSYTFSHFLPSSWLIYYFPPPGLEVRCSISILLLVIYFFHFYFILINIFTFLKNMRILENFSFNSPCHPYPIILQNTVKYFIHVWFYIST